MIVIGLTGNIGSGKSTVARRMHSLGAKIIDADQIAREVVQPGTPALQDLASKFGPDVLDSAGGLDRKKMASIVFADPQAIVILNQITHPRIIDEVKRRINKFKREAKIGVGSGVLVIDAPLLIEVGLDHIVDEIWVIKVDRKVQIARLVKRDGLTTEEALWRIAAQMPQEDKINRATRVIDNSGEKSVTVKQVDRCWNEMLAEYAEIKGSK
jgi:dephospho-CoA kinase